MPYFNRASTCKRRYRHYSGRSISTDRKSPIFESTRIDQVDYHANIIERELLYKNHDSNEHEHEHDNHIRQRNVRRQSTINNMLMEIKQQQIGTNEKVNRLYELQVDMGKSMHQLYEVQVDMRKSIKKIYEEQVKTNMNQNKYLEQQMELIQELKMINKKLNEFIPQK
ncbi:unnamed protein product [Rotaria magnacalcarata]|uniref:Uncharacterized protein n=1 Tax=Rotaria magnacalcarata TaxID=392030 RepID=A0A816XXA9_9BILA|nr:unnamed protein product [Rotaria magnacalcarata]